MHSGHACKETWNCFILQLRIYNNQLAIQLYIVTQYWLHTFLVHCYVNGDIKLNEIVKRIEYVQVYVNDVSIPICWESHTRDDVANTICRQLGLNGAKNTSSRRQQCTIAIAGQLFDTSLYVLCMHAQLCLYILMTCFKLPHMHD